MERETELKRCEIGCRNHYSRTRKLEFDSLRNPTEAKLVLRNFKMTNRDLVLDAGSGRGRFAEEFAKRGAEVVALDYSLDSLRVSNSRRKCHVILADICLLPFRDSVFDKVASISVFQHIPTMRSRIVALREIRRVSKSGAELLITVYNNRIWDRITGDREGLHRGLVYYHRFDISELRRMLLSTYSRIVEISFLLIEDRHILRPVSGFLRKIGLASVYVSSLAFLGRTRILQFLGDHILSVCKA